MDAARVVELIRERPTGGGEEEKKEGTPNTEPVGKGKTRERLPSPLEPYNVDDYLLVRETANGPVWVGRVMKRDEFIEFLDVQIYGSYQKGNLYKRKWHKAYADLIDDKTIYTSGKPKARWEPWIWVISEGSVASAPFSSLTASRTIPKEVEVLESTKV